MGAYLVNDATRPGWRNFKSHIFDLDQMISSFVSIYGRVHLAGAPLPFVAIAVLTLRFDFKFPRHKKGLLLDPTGSIVFPPITSSTDSLPPPLRYKPIA
jgi:hypothetical protein